MTISENRFFMYRGCGHCFRVSKAFVAFAVLLLFGNQCLATFQDPDVLVAGDSTLAVYGFAIPGELMAKVMEAKAKEDVWIERSSNHNQYYATLCMHDGALYLTRLEIMVRRNGDTVKTDVPISDVPLSCVWFSGDLISVVRFDVNKSVVMTYRIVNGRVHDVLAEVRNE